MKKFQAISGTSKTGTEICVGRFPFRDRELMVIQIIRSVPLGKRGQALQFGSNRKLKDGRTNTQLLFRKDTAELLRDIISESIKVHFRE